MMPFIYAYAQCLDAIRPRPRRRETTGAAYLDLVERLLVEMVPGDAQAVTEREAFYAAQGVSLGPAFELRYWIAVHR